MSENCEKPDLESQSDLVESVDVEQLHQDAPASSSTRFIIALCVLLVVCGGFYLSKYNGAFKANIFDAKATDGKLAAPKVVDPVVMGKRYFAVNCAACHQNSGLRQKRCAVSV